MAEYSQSPYNLRQPSSPKHHQTVPDDDLVDRFEKLFLSNSAGRSGFQQEYCPTGYFYNMTHVDVPAASAEKLQRFDGVQGISDYQRTHRLTFGSLKEPVLDSPYLYGNSYNLVDSSANATMGWNNLPNYKPFLDTSTYGGLGVQNHRAMSCSNNNLRDISSSFRSGYGSSSGSSVNEYAFGGLSNQQFLEPINREQNLFDKFQEYDLVGIAKDQKWSLYLQQMLATRDAMITENILTRVRGSILDLMADHFGQYVIQKLLDNCELDQVNKMVNEILKSPCSLIHIATLDHGKQSVQSLITSLKKSGSALLKNVVRVLLSESFILMQSNNGIKVIEHCLKILNNKDYKGLLDPLYDAVIQHCDLLASHEKACRFINNIIDTMPSPQRELLIRKIAKKAVFLSQDRYGNYVVQNVLDLQNQEFTDMICNELRGKFVRLSKMKCSSNVVEKCLQLRNSLILVVTELLESKEISEVANDQYGNYVIQKALQKLDKCSELDSECFNLYSRFVTSLIIDVIKLKSNRNGRRVHDLIKKLSIKFPGENLGSWKV
ncbi:hypothetical protein GIB67_013370 [Kingdonia uniflora]|uniref:PUM-HD domain-containing protein n=1 Tax=Kingdonia uniflora TaxID=39325 RepID=A0A7J7LR20_9MAGN|nr:hypothetical protein GIB67_013370 [Kingdonia uniflora]